MNKVILTFLCLAPLLIGGCSSAPESPLSNELKQISYIKDFQVRVEETGGHVRLVGTVPSDQIKSEIVQATLSFDGVTSVTNQLTVGDRSEKRSPELAVEELIILPTSTETEKQANAVQTISNSVTINTDGSEPTL